MSLRAFPCFIVAGSITMLLASCGAPCDPNTAACSGGSGGGGGAAGGVAGGGATGGGGGDAGGMGGGGGGDLDAGIDGGQDAGPAPSGESCESAIPLVSGVTVTSTTVNASDDYNQGASGGCVDATDGTGDRVFKISVPPGQRAVAYLLTPDDEFDTVLNATTSIANCGTTTNGTTTGMVCVASDNFSDDGGAEVVTWTNSGATAVDLFFIVDGYTFGDEGAFTLMVTVAPPAQGDTCSTAKPLNASLPLETWTNTGPDYTVAPRDCPLIFYAVTDRIYALDIPPQNKVTVTGTPTAGAMGLSVFEGPVASCLKPEYPVGCVASDSSGTGGTPVTVTVFNAGATVRTVYVLASLFFVPQPGETFSMIVSFAPISAALTGDVCASATPIAPGMLGGQTLIGYHDDYAPPDTCGTADDSAIGVDRVYSLDVPAGKTLTATANPTPDGGAWDLVLYVVPGAACPHFFSRCLAGADGPGNGGSETVSYTNDGGSAQPVFVIVDAYDEDHGTFDLQTTLSP